MDFLCCHHIHHHHPEAHYIQDHVERIAPAHQYSDDELEDDDLWSGGGDLSDSANEPVTTSALTASTDAVLLNAGGEDTATPGSLAARLNALWERELLTAQEYRAWLELCD